MKWAYEDLAEVIEEAGYDVEPYSGRAMFGAECVSVQLESDAGLWNMAVDLARHTDEPIPAPRTDSLGFGIVAYWPTAKRVDAA